MRRLGHLIDAAWLLSGALAAAGAVWGFLGDGVTVTLALVFLVGGFLWVPMRRVDSPLG